MPPIFRPPSRDRAGVPSLPADGRPSSAASCRPPLTPRSSRSAIRATGATRCPLTPSAPRAWCSAQEPAPTPASKPCSSTGSGCRVHLLDPVPTAAAHVANAHAHEPRITFYYAALWTEDTELTFYEPEIPGHVSHSATNLHQTPVSFIATARSITSLCAEHGWDQIDLLKISAEGSEFAIIDSVLAARRTSAHHLRGIRATGAGAPCREDHCGAGGARLLHHRGLSTTLQLEDDVSPLGVLGLRPTANIVYPPEPLMGPFSPPWSLPGVRPRDGTLNQVPRFQLPSRVAARRRGGLGGGSLRRSSTARWTRVLAVPTALDSQSPNSHSANSTRSRPIWSAAAASSSVIPTSRTRRPVGGRRSTNPALPESGCKRSAVQQ